MLSLTYSAVAEKMVKPQLPIEDLRAFAEVFGKIKSDYVEPVEDKKLISEAISGMLTGLDHTPLTWTWMPLKTCKPPHKVSLVA